MRFHPALRKEAEGFPGFGTLLGTEDLDLQVDWGHDESANE